MTATKSIQLFFGIAKIQAKMARRFDASLNGISFNEFIIMYTISQARDGKMRRVELAESMGLTPSGITRLLLPMEKIGLIKRESDKRDARAGYVLLASGGKQKLEEGLERAELLIQDIIPQAKLKSLDSVLESITELRQLV
jgi:DNA-binding MarR family transcriptional regulator